MDIFFNANVYYSAFRVFFNFAILSVGVSFIIWLISYCVHRLDDRPETFNSFPMILSMALLGGLTGYAGGNSREGVVGDVIPAVLTFLSGAVLYFFGLEKKINKITPYLLGAFVIVLFLGFAMGAKKRQLFDNSHVRDIRRLQVCIDVFTNGDILASEIAVKNAINLYGDRCEKVVDLSKYRS